MAEPSTVELEIKDNIATMTVTGPQRLNCLGSRALDDVIRIGEDMRMNKTVQLVILTGHGDKAFIGGADINEMAQFTPVRSREFITKVHQANHMFRIMPVPSIARINGYCLGAGMEMAAACDMRVASDDSQFAMPEVQLGLPSVVETTLFAGLIGWGKTREICYRGTMFSAEAMDKMGFLNAIAPRAKLDQAMQPIIQDILDADPRAVRMQKRLHETWIDSGVGAGIIASIDMLAESNQEDTPVRLLNAYLERRRKK